MSHSFHHIMDNQEQSAQVTYEEFSKMDIRVGRFISVEPIEGSEKLYKEVVDFGDGIGKRQILSGIRNWYKPEELVGKLGVFIINLAPRKMMGLESQGMLLAVDGEGGPILLTTMMDAPLGAKIR